MNISPMLYRELEVTGLSHIFQSNKVRPESRFAFTE